MSLPVMIAAGLGVGAGATLLLGALVPTRPDLAAALNPTPTPSEPQPVTGESGAELLARLVGPHQGRLAALVRVPAQDLALLERTPAAHGLRKLLAAGIGLLAPGAMVGVLALLGAGLPFTVTTGMVLAAGAVGFLLPDVDARARAKEARVRMRYAITSYLVLVALERRAGSAAQQALLRAAQVAEADNPMFARIRAALERAQLQRRPAWEGLRDLAAATDVSELGDCADIMATSNDGGAVADSLLARAQGLRGEALSHERAQANEASERMVIPVAALGLCFLALLMYPVVIRLLTL